MISRVIFRLAGVIYYGEFVKRMWQLIDVELLKSSLLESLYYSHAQPFLFNLLTGVVLKIFPQHYSHAFHVLFLLIGWANMIIIYRVLQKLKVRGSISFALPGAFMLLPAVVLYENIYSYTSINIFLLSLSIYLLLVFNENKRIGTWLLFCSVLCSLVMLRSFYHVGWAFLLIGVVLFFFRKDATFKTRIVVSLIPMLVVFAWLIKNALLFGSFSSSTWMGMNLARVVPLSTTLGKVGPFKPVDEYHLSNPSSDFPSIQLLHEPRKSGRGFVNYYHIDYIQVSNAFEAEVVAKIKSDPIAYLKRVGDAMIIYFSPASHAPFIDVNYQHIAGYAAAMNMDFSGYQKFRKDIFTVSGAWPMMVMHAMLLLALIYCMVKRLFTSNDLVVVLVMTLMISYAVVVGSFFEFGENNRFRFEHLPVFIFLSAKVLVTIYGSAEKRKL